MEVQDIIKVFEKYGFYPKTMRSYGAYTILSDRHTEITIDRSMLGDIIDWLMRR